MVNLFSGNAVIAGALVETVIEVLFTIINSLLEFIINILTLGLGFVFRLMQLIFDNTLLDSVENAFSSFDPLVKAFIIIGYGLIALLFVFHAVRSMSAVDDSNIDTPGGLIMGMATAFLIVSAGIPVVKGVAIPFFRACNDGIIKVMDSISSGTVSLSAGTVSSGFLGLEDKIRAMFEASGLFGDLNGVFAAGGAMLDGVIATFGNIIIILLFIYVLKFIGSKFLTVFLSILMRMSLIFILMDILPLAGSTAVSKNTRQTVSAWVRLFVGNLVSVIFSLVFVQMIFIISAKALQGISTITDVISGVVSLFIGLVLIDLILNVEGYVQALGLSGVRNYGSLSHMASEATSSILGLGSNAIRSVTNPDGSTSVKYSGIAGLASKGISALQSIGSDSGSSSSSNGSDDGSSSGNGNANGQPAASKVLDDNGQSQDAPSQGTNAADGGQASGQDRNGNADANSANGLDANGNGTNGRNANVAADGTNGNGAGANGESGRRSAGANGLDANGMRTSSGTGTGASGSKGVGTGTTGVNRQSGNFGSAITGMSGVTFYTDKDFANPGARSSYGSGSIPRTGTQAESTGRKSVQDARNAASRAGTSFGTQFSPDKNGNAAMGNDGQMYSIHPAALMSDGAINPAARMDENGKPNPTGGFVLAADNKTPLSVGKNDEGRFSHVDKGNLASPALMMSSDKGNMFKDDNGVYHPVSLDKNNSLAGQQRYNADGSKNAHGAYVKSTDGSLVQGYNRTAANGQSIPASEKIGSNGRTLPGSVAGSGQSVKSSELQGTDGRSTMISGSPETMKNANGTSGALNRPSMSVVPSNNKNDISTGQTMQSAGGSVSPDAPVLANNMSGVPTDVSSQLMDGSNQVRPDADFVQSDGSGGFTPCDREQADAIDVGGSYVPYDAATNSVDAFSPTDDGSYAPIGSGSDAPMFEPASSFEPGESAYADNVSGVATDVSSQLMDGTNQVKPDADFVKSDGNGGFTACDREQADAVSVGGTFVPYNAADNTMDTFKQVDGSNQAVQQAIQNSDSSGYTVRNNETGETGKAHYAPAADPSGRAAYQPQSGTYAPVQNAAGFNPNTSDVGYVNTSQFTGAVTNIRNMQNGSGSKIGQVTMYNQNGQSYQQSVELRPYSDMSALRQASASGGRTKVLGYLPKEDGSPAYWVMSHSSRKVNQNQASSFGGGGRNANRSSQRSSQGSARTGAQNRAQSSTQQRGNINGRNNRKSKR